jgi:5-bromo-4-chloroindolyl phosphate hydrolysis protein
VDQLLLEGRRQLTEMKQLGRDIPAVSAQVERLSALTEKIFTALETDVSRLPRTRKFLSYYLPTTVQLLRRYQELDRQGSGSNITTALEKIKAMLSTVEAAYQKQLDNLYEAQAMDITADIRVMEQMMAAEGLLSDDTQL